MIEQLASDLAQTTGTHPGLKELRLFGHTIVLALAQFARRNLETLIWVVGAAACPLNRMLFS